MTALALPIPASATTAMSSSSNSFSSSGLNSLGSGADHHRRKDSKRAAANDPAAALATTSSGTSGSPSIARRNSKSKNKKACNKVEAVAEQEEQEEGIHLATAVAVTVTSGGDHLDVDELLNLVRERGQTGGSTYEMMDDSDSSGRGSGYFIANGTAMSLASSSNGSSCANSTNGVRGSGGLYTSQSSTTSLPVLNLQHLQHYVSNTSYLNNHHSHHLPHLPLPLIKNGSSSSTTSSPSASLYGSNPAIASSSAIGSSPPPHLLSFFLEPSGSISPTSSCSSTTSFNLSSFAGLGGGGYASSPLSSARLDQSQHSSGSHQCLSELTSKASSPSTSNANLLNKGEASQGVRSVGEVLTLEELKRRELELSEVLSEEEWHGANAESWKRVHLLRAEQLQQPAASQGAPRTPENERREKEKEMKEQKRREKEKEKELKRSNKGKKKASSKKAESENEGRENRRDRDRTTPPGRKRANSSKSRKSEDKDRDNTSTSRSFLSSSSSAVECRQLTTAARSQQRTAAAVKDDRKARKKEEKEREKEREKARREREKEERRRDNSTNNGYGGAYSGDHPQTAEAKRKRPKYSLSFSFRNKSLSSSSLPKMKNAKNAKGTTIIPKSSPLALMPSTTATTCETSSSASSSLGSPPSFFLAAANASTTSLTSSLSYSATSTAASSAGRKKSSLSSGNSGTRRPFIFSYGSNGSSPNGSSIGDAAQNGDYINVSASIDNLTSDSESDHETEVEKDMETVTSRFFRRRGRTEKKAAERGRSRDGSPSKATTAAAKKKSKESKQTKKGKKENKDQIRQSKEDLSSKSPSRRRRGSTSRRIQYSGSEDSESPEEKTDYSLTRTKSCRSQLSSSGGSCSSRLAQLLSDSSNALETDKIDRLAKTEAVNEILKIELARLHEEKQKLELERLLWESQQKMATQLITPNKQIKLNIGGEVFFTSIETLRKYPNCTLCLIFTSHYFCSLPPEQQEKGYFIDRDAKHFRLILNFLRTGAMVWPESAGDRKELMLECEFYNLLDYVSILPRKEFCRSASKIFGSPLECDEDYRKITFHFDSSFLFLLSISFTPYFPDEAPVLHVQSLSHCDEASKPIELVYSHFLAVGTSKMDTLAERVHSFVLSQLDRIKRCLMDKYAGVTSEDEFDSLTSEDSRRPSSASTEPFSP